MKSIASTNSSLFALPAADRVSFSARSALDIGYVILLYFFATGAISRILGSGLDAQAGGGSSRVSEAANGLIYLLTIGLSYRFLPAMWRLIKHAPWLLVLYLYAMASALWSVSFEDALRDLRYLTVLLIGASYIAVRFDSQAFIRLLAACSGVMAVLSAAGGFLLPPAVDQAPGLTGIFMSKNFLGAAMVIGIAAVVLQAGRPTPLRVFTGALCTVMLFLSQSFTSILCLAAIVALLLFVNLSRRGKLVFLAMGSASAFVLLLRPDLLTLVLEANGRSSDLTGRGPIWEFGYQAWRTRPVFGHGLSGFWVAENGLVTGILGWNPQHAHNGYLELAISLGVVGLILLAILLLRSLLLAHRVASKISLAAGRLLLFMTIMLMFHDGAESDFMAVSALWFVFLVAFLVCVRAQQTLELSPTR